MRPDPADGDLRRYLLGLLPEAEAERLEEAYLAQPELWERLRGVEDDLLDDHAAGRLAEDEKQAFEGRYLASPVLRDRVVAARALRLAGARHAGAAAERSGQTRVRWALPVALVAGLVLALLSERYSQPRPPTDRSAAASPSPIGPPVSPFQTAPPAAPVASPSTTFSPSAPLRQPMGRAAVLALSPVLLRGQQEPATRRLPAGTELLELELEGDRDVLPPPSAALEARLETVDGQPVWRGEARRAREAARPRLVASVRVPAASLPPDDYLLTLSPRDGGAATLYRYFFRIVP